MKQPLDNMMRALQRLWQKRLTPHIAVLGPYAALTVLALDRLALNFKNALPGDGAHYDYSIFYWDMWWMRHALETHVNPLQTDAMIYPFTHSLALHTLVPFWGLVSLPLQMFLKLDWVLNAFVCVSFLLTAYFTFLFAYRHGSSWTLAFLAGALFAFTPPMVSRATYAHLNMLPMGWLPLALLAFDLLARSPSLGSALPLALCLYAALLTDFQYMMWIPMLLVPYGIAYLLAPERRLERRARLHLLARLGLAVLVFACLTLVYPLPQLRHLDTTGYPQATLKTPTAYSLRPAAFIQGGEEDRTIGRFILPLALAVWILGGARKRRWLWLAVAAVSILLSFGPFLSLEPYSTFRLPMPYLALHYLLRGQYRCPVRFAVPGVFSLAIFIALGGQAAFDRFQVKRPVRLGLVAVTLLLTILDYGLLRPFPVFFPKTYNTYREIAADPRDVVLLEVPLGVDTGYTLYGHGQQLIYYQPVHQKKILNGALSRMSLAPVEYFKSFRLLEGIARNKGLDAVAANELTQLIGQWNIGYVLIHRDLLSQEELGQIPPFFAMHPSLCFWRAENDLLVYRPRPPEGCPQSGDAQIALGSPESYVGEGWYLPEDIGGVRGRWAGGIPTSRLRFDLLPQPYQLRFRAWAYPPDQRVTIKVNDSVIAELPMLEAWATYTATIPSSAIHPGEPTYIQFEHALLLSPHERTQGQDTRALGAAYEWIIIEP